MKQMEEREMDAHHDELVADVKKLVEKYRSIFEWDVPEVDVALADKLILAGLRKALKGVEETPCAE
jgi:hypothetical protein